MDASISDLVGAAKTGQGIVVDHHHAEGGVAYDYGPEAERDLHQAVWRYSPIYTNTSILH